jgi:hypothetical protein
MPRLNRPLLGLLPYFWGLAPRVVAIIFFFLLGLVAPPMLLAGLVAGLFMVRFAWRQHYWLRKFGGRVRHFRTVSNHRVWLHYEPELEDRWFFPSLLEDVQKELESLEQQFDRPLRRRLHVYFFEHRRDFGEIFGWEYWGFALVGANAIVFADDSQFFQEIVRHELTHLFTHRWRAGAQPLLSEGLSVHMQQSHWGHSIDTMASDFLKKEPLPLLSLRDPRVFFSKEHIAACYALAGSFTGFLIRRHGWKNYRRWFRWCDGTMFLFKFHWCFGVSFAQAESDWRAELLSADPSRRRLRRKRDN